MSAKMFSSARPVGMDGLPVVWWEAERDYEPDQDEQSVHRLLFPHLQALEEDQAEIHVANLLNAKLYSNRELMAFEWNSSVATNFRPLTANLENLIQSGVETLFSRLATARPRAKVITRGADFGMYRKGRLLDKYLWGEFQHQDIWSKAERAWIYDPMIYGTGFLKIDIDESCDEIFMERVHPDEIVVDQRECISDAMPLCLIQRKLVPRIWLLQNFAKGNSESARVAREKIMKAQPKDWRYSSYRSPSEDQVVLVQAWKRPTYPGAGDGRMVLCIENHTFIDRKYDRDVFPFVWVKWADPESGFYGRSYVSDVMGYQINQDEMNDLLRAGRDLACVPRIFIEQGSDVQIHQIDNQVGKFIRYRGTMPECITWPAFNPEMYNERERNRENFYEFSGISQSIAQASAPTSQTRFDSSDALKEFSGQQDARLIRNVMKLERAYMEAAYHVIELSAKLYQKRGKDRNVKFMSHALIEQIPWSEVDMDRDRFVLMCSASSVLSMTPAARTDKLEGWLRDGKITLEQYYSLSGEPDLERMTDRLASQSDAIESMVDKMLQGKPQTPTPFHNLDLLINIVHDELMRLMAMDESDDDALTTAIDLHMQCLEIAKELAAPTPDPMAAMADPAMQMAPGAPMPGMTPPVEAQFDPTAATDPGFGAGVQPPGVPVGLPGF